MRGNCWLWAIRQHAREGGYVAFRVSRWWWIVPFFIRGFHVVWFRAEALPKEALGFEPIEHHRKRWFPPIWFDGEVVQGDRDWEAAMPRERKPRTGQILALILCLLALIAAIAFIDFAIIKPIYDGSAFKGIGDAVICQNFDGQRICGKVTQ